DYEREAEERWGDTEAWAQSARRTSAYTKADWVAIKAEADDVQQHFAAAMRAGSPADSAEAMAAAEDHRQHISRWFYHCPPAMHDRPPPGPSPAPAGPEAPAAPEAPAVPPAPRQRLAAATVADLLTAPAFRGARVAEVVLLPQRSLCLRVRFADGRRVFLKRA